MNDPKETYFTRHLIQWNTVENKRQMPWKGEKDPYKIWLSEIILQQTRVEQGLDYYERFIKKFPSIHKLAAAPDNNVFKLWEGLGYYSRCKNLIETAKYISFELDGIFPDQYDDIIQLKGIGPYTAAAIASFAYNLPHAVVDGNVMRLLSRFFGISTPIDNTEGKKYFNQLANKLLDKKMPGVYNQAIMDFGATVCRPQQPLCSTCVLRIKCVAVNKNSVQKYPVKETKLIKKNRWFYYIIAEYNGHFLIRKRAEKDIWQNLHEFILIENDTAIAVEKITDLPQFKKRAGKKYKLISISGTYKQELTHRSIYGCFVHVKIFEKTLSEGYEWIKKSKIKKLAFPGLITTYFTREGRSLIE